jgi:hypothetical protein
MWEDVAIKELPEVRRGWRSPVMSLNLASCYLYQPPILDARRAGGLAGTATQAEINVPNKALP